MSMSATAPAVSVAVVRHRAPSFPVNRPEVTSASTHRLKRWDVRREGRL